MKKAYSIPTLLVSGDAVRETLNSSKPQLPESASPFVYRPAIGGSLGFGL